MMSVTISMKVLFVMHRLFSIVLLLLLFAPILYAQSQREMLEQADQEYRMLVPQLDSIVDAFRTSIKERNLSKHIEIKVLDLLSESQKQFVVFRTAQEKLVEKSYEGGSSQSTRILLEANTLILERVALLKGIVRSWTGGPGTRISWDTIRFDRPDCQSSNIDSTFKILIPAMERNPLLESDRKLLVKLVKTTQQAWRKYRQSMERLVKVIFDRDKYRDDRVMEVGRGMNGERIYDLDGFMRMYGREK